MKTVIITGPESTGKSVLISKLIKHYPSVCISEFARGYVENLKHPYTYEDVELIARHQINELQQVQNENINKSGVIFVDTYLIVTKIWFLICYGKYPDWLQISLDNTTIDLYLLCKPDLPWIFDPVRENGSDSQRKILYEKYKSEIIAMKTPFSEICGHNETRTANAIVEIDRHLDIY